MPRWAVMLVIVAAIFVPAGVLVMAIAIPASDAYVKKQRATEARDAIERIFDGVATHHGETLLCPNDGRDHGVAGPTPSLRVDCHDDPSGCSPDGTGPASYSKAVWDERVWSQIGFSMSEPHYYHYSFRWHNDEQGCSFAIAAFGDLDGDGSFSTFERQATADELGIDGATAVLVTDELE